MMFIVNILFYRFIHYQYFDREMCAIGTILFKNVNNDTAL